MGADAAVDGATDVGLGPVNRLTGPASQRRRQKVWPGTDRQTTTSRPATGEPPSTRERAAAHTTRERAAAHPGQERDNTLPGYRRAAAPPPAQGHGAGGAEIDGADTHRRPLATVAPPREPAAPEADPLVALLGRSRAAVLRAAAAQAGNTTDLARRVGISAPSASQHLAVLRAAGLLATARRGNAAHHAPTSLAYALLTGLPTGYS